MTNNVELTPSTNPYTFTLYSQPGCMPCKATLRQLTRHGVTGEVVDITLNRDAANHLEREGWTGTPVVEVHHGDEVIAAWQGLRVDALKDMGVPVEPGVMAGHDRRGGDTRGTQEG